ncbi:MAG: ribosomal protein S18-alanine N-acetyltransferase [Geodermatophilaceae bacterium]|jgi:ribosomal-protein-alanine N-acetyltransferase
MSDATPVGSGVTLEPMRVEHVGEIMVLETELFGPEAWTEGMLRSELADPDSRHYVIAVGAGSVVGYAGLVAYDDEAHVLTVGVLPGWQGQGIGSALLADLLEAADARRVLLEVRADNAAAQRLYARYGFRPIGRRRGYYQPSGADAVVMARD